MALKKKKGFKLYELTESEVYKIMPKLKKRDLKRIKNKDKRLYYLRVWLVTEMQALNKLKNYNKRCWNKPSCYELDHILSIAHSYFKRLPPHLVGSIDNLRFIPKKENRDKSFKLTKESRVVLKEFKKKQDIYKKRNNNEI